MSKNDHVLKLDTFKPRHYQLDLIKAFEQDKIKRLLCVWPRRAGKDLTSFNIMLRAALRLVGTYYIVYPTFSQGRRILWDGITNDGVRFRDFIPQELLYKTNEQQMKITLVNGSQIQIVGSDKFDRLVGVNIRGCILSEFSLQDPRGYLFLRPILTAQDPEGWAIFISTPRGKNHMWDLYNIANQHRAWYVSHLTVEDTQHISLDRIQKEKEEGLMSDDMIAQEYYCSFTVGIEGAYYAKYIDTMRLEERIGRVPFELGYPVYTAWDIGVRDSSCIIMYQVINRSVHIIDCYENSKEGLEHYIGVLNSKSYKDHYGKHYAPHDIMVTEWGTGLSRYDKARELGIHFETRRLKDNRPTSAVPAVSIMDGIEAVRSTLGRVYIDEEKCKPLIRALENYRQEYDHKRKVYKEKPLHDQFSHFADAMRYLCLSLSKLGSGMSAEDIDSAYRKSLFQDELPPMFNQPRDITKYYR